MRVYVYNLRKKLEAYYAAEGREEKHRLRIPKGSYAVVLEERLRPQAESVTAPPARHVSGWWWLVPVAFVLGLAPTWVMNSKTTPTHPTDNPFFADLLASDQAAILVLGDMFLYQEYDSLRNQNRTIRNPWINSAEQFADRAKHERRPFTMTQPREYTFLISNAAHWTRVMTELFQSADKGFDIQLRTRLTTRELRNHDLVVVGMTKTIGPLRAFFSGSRLKYTTDDEFHLIDQAGVPWCYSPNGTSADYHTDYGIIARFPGPGGNIIHLFTGFWDSAATHSLDLLTQDQLWPKVEAAMLAEWGEIPEYYELFFRLNGQDLISLDYDILFLNRLEAEAIDW
ncbi:MAG: hypothetical protein AAFZ52_02870 [Bacteroidota bacterium]